MAIKKYLSLEKLIEYHELNKADIKDGDSAVKSYVNTELAKKANSSHSHTIANVDNLQATLDAIHNGSVGKVSTGANSEIFNDYANNVASGDYTHAEGEGTIAQSKHQHVQGKYNIEDTSDAYAHIIGNGDTNQSRSNAHTVDWSGNAWFAGKVYVGGTSQNDAVPLPIIQFVTWGDDD